MKHFFLLGLLMTAVSGCRDDVSPGPETNAPNPVPAASPLASYKVPETPDNLDFSSASPDFQLSAVELGKAIHPTQEPGKYVGKIVEIEGRIAFIAGGGAPDHRYHYLLEGDGQYIACHFQDGEPFGAAMPGQTVTVRGFLKEATPPTILGGHLVSVTGDPPAELTADALVERLRAAPDELRNTWVVLAGTIRENNGSRVTLEHPQIELIASFSARDGHPHLKPGDEVHVLGLVDFSGDMPKAVTLNDGVLMNR